MTALKDCKENLSAVFEVLRIACDSCKETLHDEDDIEECAVYFGEMKKRWLNIMDKVKLRL